MILSRLFLDPWRREVRRDLADCRQMHRTVMSVFPAVPPGVIDRRRHFGVLYRIEEDRRSGRIGLLVQSAVKPDWIRLPDNYLLAGEPPSTKELTAAFNAIRAGMILRFFLRANPTVSRGGTTKAEREQGIAKRNAKRHFLVGPEAQADWLRAKSRQGGFDLLTVESREGIACRLDGKDSAGQFRYADFYGLLRVRDAEAFRQALCLGIGPEKSYGCGLLSIAPA